MVIMQETKYICIAIKIENKYRNNFLILYKHIIYNMTETELDIIIKNGTILNEKQNLKERLQIKRDILLIVSKFIPINKSF